MTHIYSVCWCNGSECLWYFKIIRIVSERTWVQAREREKNHDSDCVWTMWNKSEASTAFHYIIIIWVRKRETVVTHHKLKIRIHICHKRIHRMCCIPYIQFVWEFYLIVFLCCQNYCRPFCVHFDCGIFFFSLVLG